jgi:hypothetical protein
MNGKSLIAWSKNSTLLCKAAGVCLFRKKSPLNNPQAAYEFDQFTLCRGSLRDPSNSRQ